MENFESVEDVLGSEGNNGIDDEDHAVGGFWDGGFR